MLIIAKESHTNLIVWVYDGGSYTQVAKLTEEDCNICLWQNIALTQVKPNTKCNNRPTLYHNHIVKTTNERPREKLNFSTPKREFFKHVL